MPHIRGWCTQSDGRCTTSLADATYKVVIQGRAAGNVPAVSSLPQSQARPCRSCGHVADSLAGVRADAAE